MKKLKKLSVLVILTLALVLALNLVSYATNEQTQVETRTADEPVTTSLEEELAEDELQVTTSTSRDENLELSSNNEEIEVILEDSETSPALDEPLDEGEVLSTRPTSFENTISAEEANFSDKEINYESYYINGNVFVMGSKSVNFVDSEIEGNVFILADEINFKNTTVNGTLFIGSVTATLDVTADSAYIMGDTINFESTSIFNKDVKAVAEYVSFEGVVYRDLAIYANTIETGKTARVYRNASIKVADGEFSEDIVLGNLELSIENMSEENRAQTVKEKLFDSLASFIAILVIAIIILVFFNKFVQVNKDLKVRDFIITLFTGLLEIFLGIFIAFMIMVTGYGIGYASALISLVITFAGLGKAIFVVAYAIRLAGKPEKISKLKVFFMVIFVALVVEAINCLSLLGSVASIIVAIFNIIIGISGFGTLLKVIFTKKCSKPKQKSPETPESKAEKESIKSEIREELKEEFEETKNQPHPQQEEPPKQKSPKIKKEENSENKE